jgi:hypothetical protein
MKTQLAYIFFLLVLITFLSFGYYSQGNADSRNVTKIETRNDLDSIPESASLETFQDGLSNDGEFINIESSEIDPENSYEDENSNVDEDIYTNYIWVPNSNYVYEGWTPYSDGRWVWTDWGWTWVSDYQWGWATYHYGRWWYSDAYGWVWSPGRVWGPSWVNWCSNEEYIGWYPISPRNHWGYGGFSHVNHHFHNNGWAFTRKNNFTNHITINILLTPEEGNRVLNTSTPYVNTTKQGNKIFNSGPDVKEVEKVQGTKIVQKPLTDVIDFHNSKKENQNVNVKNENKVLTNEPNKKATDPKSKTDVNNVSNYNTTKTYNSTGTYNKTNTGSKDNTNKTVNKTPNENTTKPDNTNKNVNNNKTDKTVKTGNTNNPPSSNKTGTTNKTGNTSPKVIKTPKVTQPPVKQTSPPPKDNIPPKKNSK